MKNKIIITITLTLLTFILIILVLLVKFQSINITSYDFLNEFSNPKIILYLDSPIQNLQKSSFNLYINDTQLDESEYILNKNGKKVEILINKEIKSNSKIKLKVNSYKDTYDRTLSDKLISIDTKKQHLVVLEKSIDENSDKIVEYNED